MPNLEPAKKPAPMPARTGDVFEAMRHEMNRLLDTFDRGFFDRGFGHWPSLPSTARGGFAGFDVDVRDNGDALVIEAEIPGVDEKDVTVTLANGLLTIAGEKKAEREEKKDSYYLAERSFGSFQRALRLPDTVDESRIEARFEKGVLRITAAKKPEAVRSERRIEIKKS